jgi:hypothetical protein
MANSTAKTVNLPPVGLNGNAVLLLGAFTELAKRGGWADNEIKSVLTEAMSGDYDHLLLTLTTYTEQR